MTETSNTRPRAFIPAAGDEGPFDYLGFWDWGTYRGEWSGTSVWLADMPLPGDVIVESVVQELAPMPQHVTETRAAVSDNRIAPVVFLAPVESYGFVVCPVLGHPFDVNPNYIAHIERGLPGGGWFITTEPVTKMREGFYPCLVYVVDGEARGMVAPVKHR